MDQRLFLALAISMAIILGYYTIFPPPPPPKRAQQQVQTTQEGQAATTQQTKTAPGEQSGTAQSATTQQAAPVPAVPPSAPTAQLEQSRQVVVETGRYNARFDTRGARLVSFQLNDYHKGMEVFDWGDAIPFLRSMIGKKKEVPKGNIEMVKSEAGTWPFDVELVGNAEMTKLLRNTVFKADRDGVHVTNDQAKPEQITFTGSLPNGLTFRKIFTIRPDAYVFEYELQVINYGKNPRLVRVMNVFGEGPSKGEDIGNVQSHFGPIFREDGAVDTELAEDIEGKLIVRNPEWAGITANHFLSAISADGSIDHLEYRSKELRISEDNSNWVADYGVELAAVELEPGKMISSRSHVYMGPKQTEEMQKFGKMLEESLDITLDILAVPLMTMLHWFYGLTGNYGVAIILLTVVVRVVLFPLTYKGMVSMKRMQKLQPKMASLKEKYKDNKEKLNKEMMGMYKKYRINPLGGCLPIALQIPVFFALYGALLGSIELRHSPFMLWVVDLSAKDPLYITPLLMGATMFLQQKMMPSALDPTQQKIMMWMPVIFLVFMMNFPSGLVLYWLTSNTLSILQQMIINRVEIPDLVEIPETTKGKGKSKGKGK